MRGGTLALKAISAPKVAAKWNSVEQALEEALEVEENNTMALQILYEAAEKAKDAPLSEFVADEMLKDQVKE